MPDLKKEKRSFRVEVRGGGDATPATIRGYAARFDSWSEDLGGFVEIIRPGAFANAVVSSDVRALWNHNHDLVLGRTSSGTLRLAEDDEGLAIEIDPPRWAAHHVETIDRGDVDQMSFAFVISADGDRWWQDERGIVRREITEVRELYDVSPVTYPAYAATSVSVRELLESRGIDPDRLTGNGEAAQEAAESGVPTTGGGVKRGVLLRRLRLLELEQ